MNLKKTKDLADTLNPDSNLKDPTQRLVETIINGFQQLDQDFRKKRSTAARKAKAKSISL